MMDLTYFKHRFDELQAETPESPITGLRRESLLAFDRSGLPTKRSEDWKYTSIGELFEKEYDLKTDDSPDRAVTSAAIDSMRLPGYLEANEIVFVNGHYIPSLSTIRSPSGQLTVLPLEDAATGTYREVIQEHLGCSSAYIKDGIHALNTAFIHAGVFIRIAKGIQLSHPLYFYHFSDARQHPVFSQPRSLLYIEQGANARLAETFNTLGTSDSFTNGVVEVVINDNAMVEYYKIQNETVNANQVSTTHIRQTGRSYVHAVTITLNGGIVRNNMNVVMDAAGSEAHLYGLYILHGQTHVDNHTLVDNVQPNCTSNELYKGILNDHSTGVFNGKIRVQPLAQKTNAYQTNNNILLSDDAVINTKPQLEIFADDVKCSHGCTVGQLDENALFYLRARGIPKSEAQELLLQAFSTDILDQVKPELLRTYIQQLITERLTDHRK